MFNFLKKSSFQVPQGGCLKSPVDKYDVLLSEIYPLPVRIAPEMPPPFDLDVLNQNGYPHCVGYAGAGMKQEKELRERQRIIFDGDWLYKKCKEIDGYNGPGTYLRILLKVLQKIGAKPIGQPESEAFKYRIGGYAKVDDLSLEGLKKAYYVSGVLLLGFIGSNQGWQTAYIRPPKVGESTWGHATFMNGYEKEDGIGQNSWGKNWGNNGSFYIPKNYMPFEAWAILVDLPLQFLPPGIEGFVAQEYLRTNSYLIGQEAYPYCNLNLRKEPGGEKITTLSKRQKLIVISEPIKSGSYNWVRVRVY